MHRYDARCLLSFLQISAGPCAREYNRDNEDPRRGGKTCCVRHRYLFDAIRASFATTGLPPWCNWINTRSGNLITRRAGPVVTRYSFGLIYIAVLKIWVKTLGNRSYASRRVRLERARAHAIYRRRHLIIAGCISRFISGRIDVIFSRIRDAAARRGIVKEISDFLIEWSSMAAISKYF